MTAQQIKNLITEEQFLIYKRIQKSGVVNMMDTRGVLPMCGAKLNREDLNNIITHYKELTEIYKENEG